MYKKKLVVIGGEFDGIRAAARAVRENPGIEAKVLLPGEYPLFNRCTLSYFIQNTEEDIIPFTSNIVDSLTVQNKIDILTHHRVIDILPLEKKVVFENLKEGYRSSIEYDKLIIATGMVPVIPDLDGINLGNVLFLKTLDDVIAIRDGIEAGLIKKAVIVGTALFSIYTAESLWKRGVKVTLVERGPQILPEFDREIVELVKKQIQHKGIEVLVNEKVLSLIGNAKGDVVEVHTPNHILPCDLVIWLENMQPNVDVAKNAGIKIGKTGAIEVDQYMETSIPGIYAIGNCVQVVHQITGKYVWLYGQSVDERAVQVIGNNIAHGNVCVLEKGVLGTMGIQFFDLGIAKTGLCLAQAAEEEYDIETAIISVHDERHAYSGSYKENVVKLMVDKSNHSILGVQCVGGALYQKVVDVIATAIGMGGTVEDLAQLDVVRPFSHFMSIHPVPLVAHVMLNKLEGKIKGISPFELNELVQHTELVILDVRTESEFKMGTLPGALNIPLEELESRKDELDGRKNIVLISERGRRAYLGFVKLKHMGFEHLSILDGGLLTYYPYL
jgi:NADPH-dependent 2,4-dienoyl-CoA reductase/sulfur reductase-like enzyme/rhodanese-related sulfurtransferase